MHKVETVTVKIPCPARKCDLAAVLQHKRVHLRVLSLRCNQVHKEVQRVGMQWHFEACIEQVVDDVLCGRRAPAKASETSLAN